ncbi:hypothetical protein DFH08DRAFT_958425 [Mycena albidolilacea]|uniref:ABM domain-containing protein n=1 Tax=Mycena albidolilacea TaxID=1033008 RepID=A0AAD7A7N5_9AGAR|nr:hypothetical protein DFH08DRAFT_958425 [Mycena albidolilacea]
MAEHLLVILASAESGEHIKVDWQRVAETLRQLPGSADPVVYRTAGDDTAGPRVLAIFCVVDSQHRPPEIELLLQPALGQNLDIRIYEPLPASTQILVPTSRGKHYLVLNGMTPNDAAEQTFNDWYAQEHIPMLSVVPGWQSSVRFRLLSASTSPPRYLALHEWENRDAFDTAEFKAATNTPWRISVVVEQVNKKERHLLEYKGTIEELKQSSGWM